MNRSRKIVLGVVVLAILAVTALVGVARSQDRAAEVRVEEVVERDLVSTITATGKIRARRQVNISSDVMGRVVEVNVEEGDEVEAGQVLLRLDPSQIQATVARARASLAQAEAQAHQVQANLLQAERELERVRQMRAADVVSLQALQEAETQVEVQRSLAESSRHGVEQARAGMEEAEDQLGKTTIRAPITGRVTRLNIEAGETAVVGTMNNPGSLLLTISDLSVIETVLTVDETDIPRVEVGDSASVELDAFPGETHAAWVSRIGSSAIQSGSGMGGGAASAASSVDFEVILTLVDPPPELRPDLSAVADIVVESRRGVVAVPIISVTTRDEGEDEEPIEGVWLVRDGVATFRPVELGITGREHFEIVSGVDVGDTVVSGPFQQIRELTDGATVRVQPAPAGRAG